MSRATAFSLCLQKSVNCPLPSKRSTSGAQASHKYRMSFTASAGHCTKMDTGQYIHIPCMVLTQQHICSLPHLPIWPCSDAATTLWRSSQGTIAHCIIWRCQVHAVWRRHPKPCTRGPDTERLLTGVCSVQPQPHQGGPAPHQRAAAAAASGCERRGPGPASRRAGGPAEPEQAPLPGQRPDRPARGPRAAPEQATACEHIPQPAKPLALMSFALPIRALNAVLCVMPLMMKTHHIRSSIGSGGSTDVNTLSVSGLCVDLIFSDIMKLERRSTAAATGSSSCQAGCRAHLRCCHWTPRATRCPACSPRCPVHGHS